MEVLLLLLYGKVGFIGRILDKAFLEIHFTTFAVILAQLLLVLDTI